MATVVVCTEDGAFIETVETTGRDETDAVIAKAQEAGNIAFED